MNSEHVLKVQFLVASVESHSYNISQLRRPLYCFFAFCFVFLPQGGGVPLYPKSFTVLHNDLAAHQDLCGMWKMPDSIPRPLSQQSCYTVPFNSNLSVYCRVL